MRYFRNPNGEILFEIRDNGSIFDRKQNTIVYQLDGNVVRDQNGFYTVFQIEDDRITDASGNTLYFLDQNGTVKDLSLNPVGSVMQEEDRDIWDFILGLLSAAVIFIRFIFLYAVLPTFISLTFVGWIALYILAPQANHSKIALVFLVIFLVGSYIAYIPYFFITVKRRIKKEIDGKGVLKCWFKWFLKGPFAYKK